MLRTSKPRTLYSPPWTSRSNSGSGSELPQAPDVLGLERGSRTTSGVVCCRNCTYSNRGLKNLVLPPSPGQVDRRREAPAGVREDRVVDGVVHEARHDLADRAGVGRRAVLAAVGMLFGRRRRRALQQQRVLQERVAADHVRVGVERVQVADDDLLEAVLQEAAREVARQREAPHRVDAGRLLRERADVLDGAARDVDAGRDRPVEQVRLGEGELVELRARAGRQRQRQRLAAAQEVRGRKGELAEEALELRDAGAERQLVAVLLLQRQRDVDLVLLARRLLDVDALLALPRAA